jgi:hypothetical protein
LQISAEKSSGVAFVCLVLCVSACGDPEPVAAMQTPGCGSDGALVVEIYGGVRASIDWDAGVLECQGMPRPDGEGARLRFAGPADTADGERQLAFILGLPDLVFFGTRDTANCWTDIETHERIQSAKSSDYRISGILYCVAPIVGLDGNSSISFADLTFTGRVAWEPPK